MGTEKPLVATTRKKNCNALSILLRSRISASTIWKDTLMAEDRGKEQDDAGLMTSETG